jgi:kinetochore protein NDC80
MLGFYAPPTRVRASPMRRQGEIRLHFILKPDPKYWISVCSVRRSSLSRRRSSAHGSGAPGTLANTFLPAGNLGKDPRPTDKATLQAYQNDIYEFLTEHGYQDVLTPKTLIQPTGKDFQSIFRFIYSIYDPSQRVWNKKLEDDVPLLLKAAGYPFASAISKSHLQTIGTKHSWPNMLAMLHWFVTSVKVRRDI